jgi:hypothetical protein
MRVDSSRLWQTTKSKKPNIFNDLHTCMEDAGTEFGLPRRYELRNDDEFNSQRTAVMARGKALRQSTHWLWYDHQDLFSLS